MPSNYRAGVRAEWRARDLLKERGYHTVIRAAGSKGPFDLIALAKGRIALVQVKRGKIPKAEYAALREFGKRLPSLCMVQLWRFTKGKRTPDVEIL